MSAFASTMGGEKWVLYRDRPEWSDVQPLPEINGSKPVVAIAYSEKFEDVYDYFRAVLQSNEKSERVLQLTKDAVELNSANYTAWQYRRDVLKALNVDLRPEMEYVETMIINSPKNYQVWHHRKILVEWLKDPSMELELTRDALIQDSKNYHAWQHRQWVIKTFGLFQHEMQFVEQLLNEDVRNNSAWNQRHFVVHNNDGWDESTIDREINFTIRQIMIVKNNESAWSYLRGVLTHDKNGLSENSTVTSFCEGLYDDKCRIPCLLGFIVDICHHAIQKGDTENEQYNADRAVYLCQSLANVYDTMRSKYWLYLRDNFRKYQIQQGLSEEAETTDLGHA